MNHTYLHFSFLAYNYFYQSAIWYKSHLLSWHIKSSLAAGVFLCLVKKKSQQDSYLKATSVSSRLKMFLLCFYYVIR